MKKIMFSDRFGLTKAVLDGRKTMTRRIIPNIPCFTYKENDVKKYGCIEDMEIRCGDTLMLKFRGDWYTAPSECQLKYKIGEVVAVAQSYREIWNTQKRDFRLKIGMESEANEGLICTKFIEHGGWNNKMFVRADLMPHQIRITDIKVERLQDISDEDCLKEGVRKVNYYNRDDPYFIYDTERQEVVSWNKEPRFAFAALIDKVSGKGNWEINPYVFAYSLELIK